MTKKKFLLKMNTRLAFLDSKRRNEILNQYRSLVDQSIANGNTEESAIDSFGNINSLCRLILKKEKKTTILPIFFAVLNALFTLIGAVLLIACIGALACATAAVVSVGYSLAMTALHSFLPSAYLLTASLMAAIFKIGACLIIGSILLILLIFIKIFITGIIKIIVFMINKVKDMIYTTQSTKLMKEAFNIETIN